MECLEYDSFCYVPQRKKLVPLLDIKGRVEMKVESLRDAERGRRIYVRKGLPNRNSIWFVLAGLRQPQSASVSLGQSQSGLVSLAQPQSTSVSLSQPRPASVSLSQA